LSTQIQAAAIPTTSVRRPVWQDFCSVGWHLYGCRKQFKLK
jgi:hypothetical protein